MACLSFIKDKRVFKKLFGKKKANKDVEYIISRFFEGYFLLQSHKDFKASDFFGEIAVCDNNKPEVSDFIVSIDKKSHWQSPDLFYAMLQYGVVANFSWPSEKLRFFKTLEPHEFVSKMLSSAYKSFPYQDDTYEKLKKSVSKYTNICDESLKSSVANLFSVEAIDLASHSPMLYAKVNHGYWEFLLNSVSDELDSAYRDLSSSSYPVSWRDSGFHMALFHAFSLALSKQAYSEHLKIGVGLSAGDEPFKKTMGSELSVSSRGALTGLCGFVDAFNFKESVKLYEGTAPRDMIKNGDYKRFFSEELNQFDAVLMIVPPGLKSLELPSYMGEINVLPIPGQVVHETYRVLVPIVLGIVNRLRKSHRNLCVITQSAVLAPLLAIYITAFLNDEKKNISFYDLGRVLDISRPDLVSNFPSLKWVVKSGLHHDIYNYFRLDSSERDVGLFYKG